MKRVYILIVLTTLTNNFLFAQITEILPLAPVIHHWQNTFFVNPAAISINNKKKLSFAATAMDGPWADNIILCYEHQSKSKANNLGVIASRYSTTDMPQIFAGSVAYSRLKALSFAELKLGVQINYHFFDNVRSMHYYPNYQFQESYITADIGAYLQKIDYYAGISIKNLPGYKAGNKFIVFPVHPILNLQTGYNFNLHEKIKMKPSLLFQHEISGKQHILHFNNTFDFKDKLSAGVSYLYLGADNSLMVFPRSKHTIGWNIGAKLFDSWLLNIAVMNRLQNELTDSVVIIEFTTAYLF